jgi:UDP-glucose 4-epimerase
VKILVTGGAGYIGSHVVAELDQRKQSVIVYDNLSKGHDQAIPEGVPLIVGNIADKELLGRTLREHGIDTVIHFAASSLVGESMQRPSDYYNNNVAGTLALLDTMLECGVKRLVFSSTAAVYGEPQEWPIDEDMPLRPSNVYGRTKLIIEQMLNDFSRAYGMIYVSLRYFNAAGASPGGLIGEDHLPETHLVPLVLKTAWGENEAIHIFGTDYPTADGTCIRDYIHVADLADAHVLAAEYLTEAKEAKIYNLGSESGYSVRQVIDRAKAITGVDFPVSEDLRRSGDPAVLVASSARIKRELGWLPKSSSLDTIISSAWEWHRKNPRGYRG